MLEIHKEPHTHAHREPKDDIVYTYVEKPPEQHKRILKSYCVFTLWPSD